MPNPAKPMPLEGRRAPALVLSASTGARVRLADLRGTPVVLYFYPKDSTPGCTTEALEFSARAKAFRKLGVAVFGVSPDDVDSHSRFIDKHGLDLTLLADTAHKTAEKYGVWVEKNLYGRKYWGVRRATFLIGANGNIARVWPKVKPKGHAEEVLAAASDL